MLRNKILPSGIGHTTHCFIQVEGVEGSDAYVAIEGSSDRLNIQVGIGVFQVNSI